MGIDLTKLENCRQKGKKLIARCPACAEMGQDRTGNHLIIAEDGRFGCVVYQGEHGRDHRKRIFQLVGETSRKKMTVTVNTSSQMSQSEQVTLIGDVLGHLGQEF